MDNLFKIRYLITITILLVLISCYKKKDYSELLNEDGSYAVSQIYVEGNIDGEAFTLSISPSVYTSASYHYDTADNLYYFDGSFDSVGCIDCNPIIDFSISNNMHGINFSLDSSLTTGNLNFKNLTQNVLPTIEINYWLGSSVVPYSSKNATQNQNNHYFNITSVESFGQNEYGEPVVKIGFETSCLVYNQTDYKTLNLSGFIAVAHP